MVKYYLSTGSGQRQIFSNKEDAIKERDRIRKKVPKNNQSMIKVTKK